jgi:hypothetical protein
MTGMSNVVNLRDHTAVVMEFLDWKNQAERDCIAQPGITGKRKSEKSAYCCANATRIEFKTKESGLRYD